MFQLRLKVTHTVNRYSTLYIWFGFPVKQVMFLKIPSVSINTTSTTSHPPPAFFFVKALIWSTTACFWRPGLHLSHWGKWRGGGFQKHFSQPTRPWTKTAVNWSRFHFLITFSWGTMARPLPNLGHSRPLTFFPRQLPPRSPTPCSPNTDWGSLRKCYGEMWQTHLFCLLGWVYTARQNTGRLLMPERCLSVLICISCNKKALCLSEQQIWFGYDFFSAGS